MQGHRFRRYARLQVGVHTVTGHGPTLGRFTAQFFLRDWILSDEDLKHTVDKAHEVLNATAVNGQFIGEVSRWILTSPCLDSLCQHYLTKNGAPIKLVSTKEHR